MVGNDVQVIVWFYNGHEKIEQVGAVYIYLSSPPQYLLRHCMSFLARANFPTALPSETEKIWKITLTRTSGIRLVIRCNDVDVLNVILSDSTCSDDNWSTRWSKEVEKIQFNSYDTASDFFFSHRPLSAGRFFLQGAESMTHAKFCVQLLGGFISITVKLTGNSGHTILNLNRKFFHKFWKQSEI